MTVYENVSRICKLLELPIYTLEAKAGLSNGTIGKWRKAIPSADSLKRVADVLGVTVDQILEGVDFH